MSNKFLFRAEVSKDEQKDFAVVLDTKDCSLLEEQFVISLIVGTYIEQVISELKISDPGQQGQVVAALLMDIQRLSFSHTVDRFLQQMPAAGDRLSFAQAFADSVVLESELISNLADQARQSAEKIQ